MRNPLTEHVKGVMTLLLLISIGLLSACTDTHKPTLTQITQDSKQFFNNEFKGIFLAEKTVKDNGYNQNENHYVAEMSILATAQISLNDYLLMLKDDNSYTPMEKAHIAFKVGLLKLTLPDFKAGDQITFKRRFLFIRTDNGWQLRKQLKSEQTANPVL